jgi:hypothetical protein
MRILKVFAILYFICMPVMAQSEYFTYIDDDEKTIITGITREGVLYFSEENAITIPQQVTRVCSGAFQAIGDYQKEIENLIIDGGNPYFEDGALDENYQGGGVQSSLTSINLGSGMSEINIKSLIKQGLKTRNALEKIEINGITGGDIKNISWKDDGDINAVLTEDVKVMLPAALVDVQVFGNAKVYGVFVIPEGLEVSSFCGTQMFQDIDVGSNFLFYIPVELTFDKSQVTVKRVRYILPKEGVLMHLESNTSNKVELPRVNQDDLDKSATGYINDQNKYQNNMLVGVTQATPISPTEGEYTNMILYNGLFYPTTAGTLNANRAYLRVRTSDLTASGNKVKLSVMKAQCATPTITLKENGKVKVECATEDATCVTNIVASSANPDADGEFNLNAPLTEFTITAYATATGYRDSDVATSTLHWERAEDDVNRDGTVDISDVVLLINKILGSDHTNK